MSDFQSSNVVPTKNNVVAKKIRITFVQLKSKSNISTCCELMYNIMVVIFMNIV